VTPLYEEICIRKNNEPIIIDSIAEQGHEFWESVSDITGTAIPLYYAIKVMNKDINKTGIKLTEEIAHVNILRLANFHKCNIDNSFYKLNQIKKYNWLSREQLDRCVERVQSLADQGIISPEGEFGKYIECTTTVHNYRCTILGEMDYVDNQSVVEFKCVKNLETEHMIQLLLYKFINETNDVHYDNYYLYNVLDDQLYSLHCTYENLENIISKLIQIKFIDEDLLDNDVNFMEHLREEGITE